ncbi:transcriptional regulator DegA [Sphingobacterium siyangense subsp. cladoniae]|uniref:LacI family DNA-binding transcriptional regulator n=1 Tax=Sphingobacterium siyangense TaxID=459529 RepID=UPI0031F791D6
MKRITLTDIAKSLNLSTSTISRALRGSHDISQTTKRMVLDYIEKINYIPNPSAQGLKTGHSNILAIILPFISSSFFFDFYEEISLSLMETKYRLILLQTFNDENKEKEILTFCIQNNIGGIIISPVKNDSSLSLLKYIMEQICPVIIFDRINHQLETFKIGIQNDKIIFQATEEMIKNKRENIILLLCKGIGENTNRIKGYKNALLKNKIPFNPDNILEISYSSPKDEIHEEVERKIGTLLKKVPTANAILSTTDTLSLKVLHSLDKLSIRVPKDMLVIGFSNTLFANSLYPPLTTVNQPTQLMAKKSIGLLLDMIEKKHRKKYAEFETIFFDCDIIHRESTSIV